MAKRSRRIQYIAHQINHDFLDLIESEINEVENPDSMNSNPLSPEDLEDYVGHLEYIYDGLFNLGREIEWIAGRRYVDSNKSSYDDMD